MKSIRIHSNNVLSMASLLLHRDKVSILELVHLDLSLSYRQLFLWLKHPLHLIFN